MTEHDQILQAIKDVSKQVEYLTDLVINSVVKRQPASNGGEPKVDRREVKEPTALELDAQLAFDDFTRFYLPALYDHGYLIAKAIKVAEQSATEEVELPARSIAALVSNTFRVWARIKPVNVTKCPKGLFGLLRAFPSDSLGIGDIIPSGDIRYLQITYSTETYCLAFARQLYKELEDLRTQILRSSIFPS